MSPDASQAQASARPPDTSAAGEEGPTTERRRHPRIPVDGVVRLTAEDLDLHGITQAVDLSHGGIFVRTEYPPPVGTALCLEIDLGRKIGKATFEGQVVRVVPPLRELRVPPGVGIRFTRLDENGRRFIEMAVRVYNARHPGREIRRGPPSGSRPDDARPTDAGAEEDGGGFDPGKTTRSKLLDALGDEDLRQLCQDSSKFTERLRKRARELLRRRGSSSD